MRELNKVVYQYAKVQEKADKESSISDINQVLTNSHIEEGKSTEALQPKNRANADEILKSTLETLYKDDNKVNSIQDSFKKQRTATRTRPKVTSRKVVRKSKAGKTKKKIVKKKAANNNNLYLLLLILVAVAYYLYSTI